MHLAAIENIFFLVLVAIVGLLRWVLQSLETKRNAAAGKRARQQQPTPNVPVERAPAQTEEERVRRFMEALGVPTNTPPPKTAPRRVTPKAPRPPKRQIAPVDPFPKPTTTWNPDPVIVVPPPPPVIAATPPPVPSSPINAPETLASPATTYEVHLVESVVRPEVPAAAATWATRLATREGARNAVVLREIFGPPRGLQPFDVETLA